ncbi:MAG: LON peptidase substrate-binding domain-containing protein, partial [Burkholderiales bacterium]
NMSASPPTPLSTEGWTPLFPLGTVLFPDGFLPLRIFETRYIDMTRRALKSHEPFGVCLIREGREVGGVAQPHPTGTLAQITECDMQQLGVLQVKTRGGARFRILEQSANSQGLALARIETLPPEEDSVPAPEYAPCVDLLKRIIAEQKSAPVFLEPYRYESASWVGYRLAEILPIPMTAKQKLLELDDAPTRLQILFRFLEQRGLTGKK